MPSIESQAKLANANRRAIGESAKSLKIVFHVSRDAKSGTYFRYHNLALALKERGHEVTVLSQNGRAWRTCQENREGINYQILPGFVVNRLCDYHLNPGILGLRALHPLPEADVHHLFQPFLNSAVPWMQARREKRYRDALFAWDWDDLWCGGLFSEAPAAAWSRWQYRLLEQAEHRLPARAALVTTCSTYLSDLAKERGARATAIVHNGIWPSEVHGDANKELRDHFGLSQGAFYMGFIGWTHYDATWCLELLGRLDASVRLVSCGYDIRRELPHFPGLESRVDYLGALENAEARKLMQCLDVGLLPLSDTPFNRSRLPIKFGEYLAAGCPVVCGSVGELQRIGNGLKGVVLLPAEQTVWLNRAVLAIEEIRHSPHAFTPEPRELASRLGWPVLAAQLEKAYCSYLPCNA